MTTPWVTERDGQEETLRGWAVAWCWCAEEVGEWQGRKVVMQEPGWTEGIYYYYRYDGPFLLGEPLGWSEVPWDIRR